MLVLPDRMLIMIGILDMRMSVKPRKTFLPCREDTLQAVRSCKRGGETYDSLLKRMASQYEPPERDRSR
jgi:hypothetical protein